MKNSQWKHLESRSHLWRKQLYIKGRRIRAFEIYSEMLLNDETPEETAKNWDLPLTAVHEAIEYCQNNQELLENEKKEENLRLKNKVTKRKKISQFLEWLLLIVIAAVLVVLVRNWLRFILIPIFLIFFLRIADHIPIIGPKWKWLFGERSLWEWMTLLFVPIVLSMLGLYFSALFTASQGDVNVEEMRHVITNNYLTTLQDQSVISAIKKTDLSKFPYFGDITEGESKHCRNNHDATWLRNQTLLALDELTNLKTSKPFQDRNKKFILEFLHNSGLIGKDNNNYLSLRYANMTGSDLVQVRLENACLESVSFAESDTSSQSRSDFRHAILEGSDLRGANLAKANLRNANLKNTDLGGWASLYHADLRGADLTGTIIEDDTTVMQGAIYNTKIINVQKHKNNPISNFFCHKSAFVFYTSGLCIDSVDYINLQPTKFPERFYEGGQLNKDKLKELEMEEDNRLALFQ